MTEVPYVTRQWSVSNERYPKIGRSTMTDNTHEIDRRLVRGLSGREKLKLLLKQEAGSLTDWARQQGVDIIEIHHTLAGRREYPEHRQRIADSIRVDRAEVDRLIDESAEPAHVSAA